MAYEIERKFLVKSDYQSHVLQSYPILQGYLSLTGNSVVRVRVIGDRAFLTVKSAVVKGGITRHEWEYRIPVADAQEMLSLCGEGVIKKTRHHVRVGSHLFEVDEFHGENEGLVIAEIELVSEDELFEKPQWLGDEVTGDVQYYNAYLSNHPYKEWGDR